MIRSEKKYNRTDTWSTIVWNQALVAQYTTNCNPKLYPSPPLPSVARRYITVVGLMSEANGRMLRLHVRQLRRPVGCFKLPSTNCSAVSNECEVDGFPPELLQSRDCQHECLQRTIGALKPSPRAVSYCTDSNNFPSRIPCAALFYPYSIVSGKYS